MTHMKNSALLLTLLTSRTPVVIHSVIAGKPVTAEQKPHMEANVTSARVVLDRLLAYKELSTPVSCNYTANIICKVVNS
jgi:hypothetical protein